MVWYALCVILALARLLRAGGHDEVCSRVAFQPLSKELTCDTTCTDPNTSVLWSLKGPLAADGWQGTFQYNKEPILLNGNYKYGITVDAEGKLHIEKVNIRIHQTKYNCTAVFSNGSLCGKEDVFNLKVIQLFTDSSVEPYSQRDCNEHMYIGSKAVLCYHGSSPGVDSDSTFWTSKDLTTSKELISNSNNIADECPTCTTCNRNKLLSLPSVRNSSNSRYSHYLIAVNSVENPEYNQCFNIPNRFVSFLVISQVREEDARKVFTLFIRSKFQVNLMWPCTTTVGYKPIDPVFVRTDLVQVQHGNNGFVVCNATTTGDVRLTWGVYTEDSSSTERLLVYHNDSRTLENSPVLGVNATSDQLISKAMLDRVCAESTFNTSAAVNSSTMLSQRFIAFSLSYPPGRRLFSRPVDDGALVVQQQLLLVICGASQLHDQTYACSAQGVSEVDSMYVKLEVFEGSGSSSRGANVGAIIGLSVAGMICLVFVVLVGMWAHRRYRQLKYEAMQMRPVDIPLALTQLTHAVNQAYTLSPIGSPTYDQFEFPRQNLTLLEVIGEGQFGQVWKARAVGICNEDSRNIVAVKTLKENHRESDYFDLRSELDIMRNMEPHPNIINLLGVCSDTLTNPLCILMEYAAYGSLKDYLSDCRRVMQAQETGAAEPYLHSIASRAPSRLSKLLGDYPRLQQVMAAQVRGNDYHYDPMVVSRAHRVLKMLQLEGYQPNDDGAPAPSSYDRLEPAADQEGAGRGLYNRLYPQSQCVYRPCLETYNYIGYLGGSKAVGGQGEQLYYNAGQEYYYHQGVSETEGQQPRPPIVSVTDSTVPASPGGCDTSPLITTSSWQSAHKPAVKGKIPSGAKVSDPALTLTPNRQPPLVGQASDTLGAATTASDECLSPTTDDVFENPDEIQTSNLLTTNAPNLRESMISFPDGYIYAPASTRTSHGDGGSCNSEQSVDSVRGKPRGEEGEEAPAEKQQQQQQQWEEEVEWEKEGRGKEVDFEKKELPPVIEEMISYMDILDFAVQIARGMNHLQKMQCVHRDLAARNILISEDFTLKIGDFGLARELSDKDYYRKVTPGRLPARWMAPESLEERTHTYKSDVWSYAVVLWEVLTYGEVPYRGLPEANDCDNLAYYLCSGNRLPRPPNTTDEIYDLMTSCWALNQDKRPSFVEVISILDNHLSAAHGYLPVSAGPALSREPGVSSANPSPLMQKRKAMLQKLDKLQGMDRPLSIQPASCAKRQLGKSPSLPVADPVGTGDATSPYLLPNPTGNEPSLRLGSAVAEGIGLMGSVLLGGVRFGSNPELSLSLRGSAGVGSGAGDQSRDGLKLNGHGPVHNPRVPNVNLETQL